MTPFRIRTDGEHLVVLVPRYDRTLMRHVWDETLRMDRVWAANLAVELEAWLAGTDEIPRLEENQ